MRRSTLFVGILSLLHATDLWCHCEDDEITLLQMNKRVQAQTLPSAESLRAKSVRESAREMAHPRAEALLESVRHLAHQMTSESPEVVSTTIEAVKAALAQMRPKIIEEHEQVRLQIQHQLQEIQACHSSEGHGATVVSNQQDEIAIIQACRDAVDSAGELERRLCDEWENHARVTVPPPCLSGSGPEQVYSFTETWHNWVLDAWPNMQTMRGNCRQATETRDQEEARCGPVIDRNEEAYCQRYLSCHLLSACHHHEVAVYESLRNGSLAGQNSRQDQWRILIQADCILDLITGGVDTNETVGDVSMNSCDDAIDVLHLVLTFPDPEHWPECPSPSAGDPQCPEVQLPGAWDDGAPALGPQPIDGVLCVPLLQNYQVGEQCEDHAHEEAPYYWFGCPPSAPANTLNSGTFSSVKVVWKSGRISGQRRYDSGGGNWQTSCSTFCGSGSQHAMQHGLAGEPDALYCPYCGAAFELVQNGHNVIEQPDFMSSAPQCVDPIDPTGDIICHQPLDVFASDNFIVTWWGSRQRWMQDWTAQEVDLVVDLFGCI